MRYSSSFIILKSVKPAYKVYHTNLSYAFKWAPLAHSRMNGWKQNEKEKKLISVNTHGTHVGIPDFVRRTHIQDIHICDCGWSSTESVQLFIRYFSSSLWFSVFHLWVRRWLSVCVANQSFVLFLNKTLSQCSRISCSLLQFCFR